MRYLILFIYLLCASSAFAQTDRYAGIHIGIPIINEKLDDGYTYKPFQLLFYYNFTNLLKGKKNDLFVYVEPQLVWVHFSPDRKKEIEFGANLGLEYRLHLSDQTAFTGAIGTGPHYITVETPQQVKGFIFSDNFTFGVRQKLKNTGMDLHLRTRFRHISNANLKKPNKGIDSWFILVGATKEL